MVTWILAVLGLYLAQLMVPSFFRIAQDGVVSYVGSRDSEKPLVPMGDRAMRAQHNMEESLFFFIPLALILLVLGKVSETAILGAELFFFSRLVYVPLYMFAVPWIRSIVWTAGFVGLVLMVMPLLG